MRMNPHAMLGADPAGLAGVTLGRRTLRRVLAVARPYRKMIAGFLGTIVAAAILNLAPPLAFRAIIDDAIPDGNRSRLALLAGLAVGAALAEAVLAVAERWWSARIGEGVIFDLRVALFDHVQHMPLDFFTRTQTGALISRLNNDVIGAQRALTGTLGQVVSNAIVLVTTLTAMFWLEWQLTLLSLALLPVFILPAKRVGRRLQAMTRQQMDLNASMNTTMTERFGVSGALLVKLFGRHDDERLRFADQAGQVRDIGVRSALYGRTFFIALGLVGATGTAAIYWLGGNLVISGAVSLGTLVALAAYVTRIYQPLTSLTNARVDLMTTLVSFERVFEVLDAPNPIGDHPGAVDLVDPVGRIELDHVGFAYPASGEHAIASLEGVASTGTGLLDTGAPRRQCVHRGRNHGGPGRSVGRGQVHTGRARCPASTTSTRAPCASTATTSASSPRRACGEPSVSSTRTPTSSTRPSPRTCATPGRRPARPICGPRAKPPGSPRWWPDCPRAWTPWSASGATGSRVARSSAWPSPGCC